MEISDTELIGTYLQGDEKAFRSIVSRYTRHIYNFVARLSGDREESHDLTQEVFVKVWKNIRRFDTSKNFKTWIFSIARNTTIDYLRKRKSIRFPERQEGDVSYEESLRDVEPLPDEIFSRAELARELEQALATLSKDDVTILFLHHDEEMTFEEIGEVLRVPMNTVKSRYRRALHVLRKEMT